MATSIGAALRRVVGIDDDKGRAISRVDSSATATPAPPMARVTAADSAAVECRGGVDSCDPVEHARALLRWLQGDGGAVGELSADEIQKAYSELCAERNWTPLIWHRTGRSFAKIVGPRRYRDLLIDGKKCRRLVYYIPSDGEIVTGVERARHPGAPMPARLSQIEASLAALAANVAELADAVRGAGRGDLADGARIVHFDRRA